MCIQYTRPWVCDFTSPGKWSSTLYFPLWYNREFDLPIAWFTLNSQLLAHDLWWYTLYFSLFPTDFCVSYGLWLCNLWFIIVQSISHCLVTVLSIKFVIFLCNVLEMLLNLISSMLTDKFNVVMWFLHFSVTYSTWK